MRHISLKEMLETEVSDLLNGYPDRGKTFYWKNGDGDIRCKRWHIWVSCDNKRQCFHK